VRCWVHLLGQVVGLLLAHCSNFVGLLHGQGLLQFLGLACSADLIRAELVVPWLMKHLTASGGYRINLQINYRSSAGRELCVGVGGGGRELASYAGSRSENLVRASVISGSADHSLCGGSAVKKNIIHEQARNMVYLGICANKITPGYELIGHIIGKGMILLAGGARGGPRGRPWDPNARIDKWEPGARLKIAPRQHRQCTNRGFSCPL
jgi:hypothetical protein